MGRPLFSASYSTPAVRTEPEITAPPSIHFEKWAHWNAFDPDSDEFFDSAVYEAFLDPADMLPATEEGAEARAEVPELERLDAIIARELEESRSYSSASSEGTISGRGSPMAIGSDDPAGMIVDAYRAGEFEPHRQRESEAENTGRVVHHQSIDVEYRNAREDLAMHPLHDDDVPVALDLINERRVSRVMPPLSPFRSRGFIPHFPHSTRTMTPPHPHDQDQNDAYGYMTHERTSPSPAPSVTPRLYSWSSRGPLGRNDPGSPSPIQRQRTRPGPLTNPNARLSLAHLSPAPVRVRMA